MGPKLTYTLAYNNYDMLVENCIGTWSGERMQASYTLVDSQGRPWPADNPRRFANHGVDQPYAIFGVDRQDRDKHSRARLLGSIAYVTQSDRCHAGSLISIVNMASIQIADTVAYIQAGHHTNKYTFRLSPMRGGVGEHLTARNLLSIGGQGASIHRAWQVTDHWEGPSLTAALRNGKSFFTTSQGSRLLRRYVDGVLTDQPLWPWPMNGRILAARKAAGYSPVDVTATIELLLGPIPARRDEGQR